jgi:hypothetical protein
MYDTDGSNYNRGTGVSKFPSPFNSVGATYNPLTQRQLFKYCSYYFLTNPIINPIIFNLAAYPITEIVVDEIDDKVRNKWQEIIYNKLKLPSFSILTGLDFYTYGNCIVYIYFPIQKRLRCNSCKKWEIIEKCNYKYKGMYFQLTCNFCEATTEKADVHDAEIKDINRIKLMRINPELVDIEYNEFTGHSDYFIQLPQYFKNQIRIGTKHIIENIPQSYIDGVRDDKRFKLIEGKFFHLKRESISNREMGWGRPLIEPVLTMGYQLQTLLRAQEAILNGYILPLRVVFPQPADANSSPSTTINLTRFNSLMTRELEKHRMDPNHIVISPIPVGSQIIGAEGKSMTLFQELEMQANIICNGMGVPLELWKGGLSWTGSNMSLKLLENKFLFYRTQMLQLMRDFILPRICTLMEETAPKISFAPFRLSDDLQRSALLFQLYQSQILSGRTLLESLGQNYAKEQEFRSNEKNKTLDEQKSMQLANANIQGQAQLIQAQYAVQAQKQQMKAGLMGGGQQQSPDPIIAGLESPTSPAMGVDVEQMAGRIASQMQTANPQQRQEIQFQLQGNPDLLRMVNSQMFSQQGSQENPLSSLQMPSPSVKPPRRDGQV